MDIDAFAKALHDDWYMVDATGKVITKEEELALLRSADFRPSSIRVENLHVALHGDTAIVSGISNVRAQYKGQDMSGRYRFTQVYKAQGENLLETAVQSVPPNFVMATCINFLIT